MADKLLETNLTPEEASREAVHAMKNAQQAVEVARAAAQAEQTAEMTESVIKALRIVFGENVETGRFIDTTKIPFMCKDIETIKDEQAKQTESIEKIHEKLDAKFVTKERFSPVEIIVYGLVGLILTAVVGALIASVIIK